MKTPFYQAIARTIQAISNCEKSGNIEWQKKNHATLKTYNDLLPTGAGFDSGCKIDLDASTAEKIVITCNFHYMNNAGYYDGWKNHSVVITSSLAFGFNLKVMGRNTKDLKEYISDTFHNVLLQNYEDLVA